MTEIGGTVRLACRASVAVVVGALMVASLAACDGGGSDRGPIEIDGSSTVEDYDPTVLPERPDDENTDDGAYAFAAHVVELIDYVFATADTEAIDDLVPEGEVCDRCIDLQEVLQYPREEFGREEVVIRDEPTVREDPRIPERDENETSVAYTLTFGPAHSLDAETGEVLDESSSYRTEDILIRMTWVDGRWWLLDWDYYDVGEIEEQYS